jgi:hypothetical protein
MLLKKFEKFLDLKTGFLDWDKYQKKLFFKFIFRFLEDLVPVLKAKN